MSAFLMRILYNIHTLQHSVYSLGVTGLWVCIYACAFQMKYVVLLLEDQKYQLLN